MFFGLDADQLALARAVRDLVDGRFGPDWVRASFEAAVSDAPPAGHDQDLWSAMTDQGWLALTVPEDHDGLGLGLLDAVAVATELGAATLPGPWRGTVLLADTIRLGGTPEQQKAWLPGIAAGTVIGSLAINGDPLVVAGDGTLSGVIPRVEYADSANTLVVCGDDALLRLVNPGPGFASRRQSSLDGTTALHEVTLSAAPAAVVGDISLRTQISDRAAVLVAADMAGAARRWIERTVDYDRTREQFGRPVGSFQAIKHHLADLHTATTMAGYAVLAAAYLLDAGDPGASLAVSVAKAKASDAAVAVTAAAVQYHGGIGYTWEHDAHFAFKRVRRLAQAYGSADWHRERIAQLALDPLAAV